MFKKRYGKVAGVLGVSLLLVIASAYATNIESIHFYRVDGCSTSESTANTWCTEGTDKLCEDTATGDLDVAVDVELDKTGWTTGWGSPPDNGFDEDIDDDTEEGDLMDYMASEGVSYVIVAHGLDGCLGYCDDNDNIYIAGEESGQGNVTLVHEIGHKAGCTHVSPNVTLRIMNSTSNGEHTENRVTPSERTDYESL